MKYTVIIEKGEKNYSAYIPDLPGCVSTGDTIEEIKKNILDAVEFHIQGMKEDGEPIPEPTTLNDYIEVAA
ncbi:MAG: type II toxin-antitoxin system HicB family antitoxin [Ignavibacteriae bacterium]|nr:type II toxin-antitoxin system HicB family antitoxin [Ignavibacteriota bacterium]